METPPEETSAVGGSLEDLRERIRDLDESLFEAIFAALKRRDELVRQVGEIKKAHDVPAHNPDVEARKIAEIRILAQSNGFNMDRAQALLELIMQDSKQQQIEHKSGSKLGFGNFPETNKPS